MGSEPKPDSDGLSLSGCQWHHASDDCTGLGNNDRGLRAPNILQGDTAVQCSGTVDRDKKTLSQAPEMSGPVV